VSHGWSAGSRTDFDGPRHGNPERVRRSRDVDVLGATLEPRTPDARELPDGIGMSEDAMIQRLVGLILGGVTIWLILTLGEAVTPATQPRYLVAIVVGLIVAAVYPWLMGMFLVRRARDRRNDAIDAEVERRLA
jgi:hypothetical protein